MPVGAIRRAFFDPETVSVHSQNKYADDLSHRIDTLISIKTAMQQLINTLRGLPRKVTKMQSEDLEKAAGSRDGLRRRQHPFHLSQRHRDLTAQSYPFAPAVLTGVFPLAAKITGVSLMAFAIIDSLLRNAICNLGRKGNMEDCVFCKIGSGEIPELYND